MGTIATSCDVSSPEHLVVVVGELDLRDQERVGAAIESFRTCHHKMVRIDASQLEFIDSTAMALIGVLTSLAHQRRGAARVTGAGRTLDRVIDLMGIPIEVQVRPAET